MAWLAFIEEGEPVCLEETGIAMRFTTEGMILLYAQVGDDDAPVYHPLDPPVFFNYGHQARDWCENMRRTIANEEADNGLGD